MRFRYLSCGVLLGFAASRDPAAFARSPPPAVVTHRSPGRGLDTLSSPPWASPPTSTALPPWLQHGSGTTALVLRFTRANYALATTEAGLLRSLTWRRRPWGLNDNWIAHHGGVSGLYLDRYRPGSSPSMRTSPETAERSRVGPLAGADWYRMVMTLKTTPKEGYPGGGLRRNAWDTLLLRAHGLRHRIADRRAARLLLDGSRPPTSRPRPDQSGRYHRAKLPGLARLDPVVQRPRTRPFQGRNTGSNPVGVATHLHDHALEPSVST